MSASPDETGKFENQYNRLNQAEIEVQANELSGIATIKLYLRRTLVLKEFYSTKRNPLMKFGITNDK